MAANLRKAPIVLAVLAHTGKLTGDDGRGPLLPGYRGFGFIPEDEENPDPLVSLDTEGFNTMPVYASGHNDARVTGGRYEGGIGGKSVVLLRKPAARALWKFQNILGEYGLSVLALDGYRPVEVQRQGFVYLVGEILTDRFPGKEYKDLTIEQQFEVGLAADDVFAYVNAVTNIKFEAEVAELFKRSSAALYQMALVSGKSARDIAEEIVTYHANLGIVDVDLDADAPMAHRGGGALDLFPLDLKTMAPALLGVPFDYPSPAGLTLTPSAMHFFEDKENWKIYQRVAKSDPLLKKYLELNGVKEVTDEVCEEVRGVRRILFHAAYATGWTHYINECFHFNAPNTGGNQETLLPGGGNTCQSLLRNVRDVRTGEILGNWTPAVADRLSVELYAKNK